MIYFNRTANNGWYAQQSGQIELQHPQGGRMPDENKLAAVKPTDKVTVKGDVYEAKFGLRNPDDIHDSDSLNITGPDDTPIEIPIGAKVDITGDNYVTAIVFKDESGEIFSLEELAVKYKFDDVAAMGASDEVTIEAAAA